MWVPPHPQRGTPYHRYVVLLLPQAHPTERISVPQLTDAGRLGFDVRAFCARHGLNGSKGGGAHMWREVWDETVSKIYRDVLSESCTAGWVGSLLMTSVQKRRSRGMAGRRRRTLTLKSREHRNTCRSLSARFMSCTACQLPKSHAMIVIPYQADYGLGDTDICCPQRILWLLWQLNVHQNC